MDLSPDIVNKPLNQQNIVTSLDDEQNTTPKHFDGPLSPVLSNNKNNFKLIARNKTRLKLINKFSQSNSSEDILNSTCDSNKQINCNMSSSSSSSSSPPLFSDTDDFIVDNKCKLGVIPCDVPSTSCNLLNSVCSDYKQRMQKIKETERNKKFRYDIAKSTTIISSKPSHNNSSSVILPQTVSEESFNLNKNDSSKSEIVGFKLSSGKNIQISENSTKYANQLLEKVKIEETDVKDNGLEFYSAFNSNSETTSESGSDNSDSEIKNESESDISDNTLNDIFNDETIQLELESLEEVNFKVPNLIENKKIKKQNEDNLKNTTFSQISDTQMFLAVENAENMMECMESQWIPSPHDKSKSTINEHSENLNISCVDYMDSQWEPSLCAVKPSGATNNLNKIPPQPPALEFEELNQNDLDRIDSSIQRQIYFGRETIDIEGNMILQSCSQQISDMQLDKDDWNIQNISDEDLILSFNTTLNDFNLYPCKMYIKKYIKKLNHSIKKIAKIQRKHARKMKKLNVSKIKRPKIHLKIHKKEFDHNKNIPTIDISSPSITCESKSDNVEIIEHFDLNKYESDSNFSDEFESLRNEIYEFENMFKVPASPCKINSLLDKSVKQKNIDYNSLEANLYKICGSPIPETAYETPAKLNKTFKTSREVVNVLEGQNSDFNETVSTKTNHCNSDDFTENNQTNGCLKVRSDIFINNENKSYVAPVEKTKNIKLTEINQNNLGFSTASGKFLPVSEKSLQTIKNQFNNEKLNSAKSKKEQEFLEKMNREFSSNDKENSEISGNIRDKHKEEINATKSREEQLNWIHSPDKENIEISNDKFGFSTASGKSVNISEKSLKKIQKKFNEELKSAKSKKEQEFLEKLKLATSSNDKENYEVSNQNYGFSTASGKTVNISEKSLQKVKKKYNEESTAAKSKKEQEFLEKLNSEISSNKEENKQSKKTLGHLSKKTEKSLQKIKHKHNNEKLKSVTPNTEQEFIENINAEIASDLKEVEENNREIVAEQRFDYQKTSKKSLQNSKSKYTEDKLNSIQSSNNEENLQNDTTLVEPLNNIGFSTASGKSVNISEKSLQKIKKKFNEELSTAKSKKEQEFLEKFNSDFSSNNEEISTEQLTNNSGFSTASGKSVNISEKSLKKIKKKFNEELNVAKSKKEQEFLEKLSSECSSNSEENVQSKKLPNKNNSGFSTASGKSVNISEKSLKKMQKKLNEELNAAKSKKEQEFLEKFNSEFSSNHEENLQSTELANKNNSGFSTASGKSVNISEKSLQKIKKKFNEELNAANSKKEQQFLEKLNSEFSSNKEQNEQREEIPTVQLSKNSGFSTASGKSVNISEKSLQKVKKKFNEELNAAKSKKEQEFLKKLSSDFSSNSEENVQSKKPPNKNNSGFSTASGKSVNISEKSLQKMQKKLNEDVNAAKSKKEQEFLEKLNSEFSSNEENLQSKKLPSKNDTGFSTASGKSVNISDKSLQKVKRKFNEDVNAVKSKKEQEFLEKLNSEFSSNNEENVQSKKLPNKNNSGFSTASGKSVNISEKSLKKMQKKFNEEIDAAKSKKEQEFMEKLNSEISSNEENLQSKKLPNKNDTGFSTASGKSVNISEKSLQKVQKKFNEDLNAAKSKKEQEFLQVLNSEIVSEDDQIENNFDASLIITDEESNEVSDKTNDAEKLQKEIELLLKIHSQIFSNDQNKTNIDNFSESDNENELNNTKAREEDEFLQRLDDELILNNEDNANVSNQNSPKSKKAEEFLNNLKQILDETENILSPIPSTSKQLPLEEENLKAVSKTPKSISSPALGVKRPFKSPHLGAQSTPVLKKKKITPSNIRKRSLGSSATTCRQLNLTEHSAKKARMIFEEIDVEPLSSSPSYIPTSAKKITSPVFSGTPKRNISENLLNPSTPVNGNSPNLLNSSIALKETNNLLSSQKNNNLIESKSFSFREKSEDDFKARLISIEKRNTFLRLEMSINDTRWRAIIEQDVIIKKGSPEHRRQRKGYLFSKKSETSNKITLQNFVNNRRPEKFSYLNVDDYIINVTPENASKLHFFTPWWSEKGAAYPAVIRNEDNAVLIPNGQNLIGISEIENGFLSMPGVDPTLVPEKWVENHYRWIIWKLASYERNYPDVFTKITNVENVMLQLKYRYDREIDRAQRPALRKILEKDDTPAKRMVLCVATIYKFDENKIELELTDGWYSIQTIIDSPLIALVNRNIIKIGMKLIIQGAELINCEDGCPPLEIPANVRLQIHYNSTRRAAWYAKLGFQSNLGPLCIGLHTIHNNGGIIGKTSAYIARVYPESFLERSGSNITWRDKKAEMRRINDWETDQSHLIEKLEQKLKDELEKELTEKRKNTQKDREAMLKNIKQIQDGQTIYELWDSSNDPESFCEMLNYDQILALQDYRFKRNAEQQIEFATRLQEKLANHNMKKRDVSSVLKLIILDVNSPFHYKILNIWNPTDSIFHELKEGTITNIYNVSVRNNGTLSTIKRSQFTKNCNYDVKKFEKFERTVVTIKNIIKSTVRLLYDEFDSVGLVVYLDIKETEQEMWLADENYHFLIIRVRDSPQKCRIFDGIDIGKIIAVQNLSHNKNYNNYAISHGNHYTSLYVNPSQTYLKTARNYLQKHMPKDLETYLNQCSEIVEMYIAENISKRNKLAFKLENSQIANNSEMQNSELRNDIITASDEEMSLIDTQAFE